MNGAYNDSVTYLKDDVEMYVKSMRKDFAKDEDAKRRKSIYILYDNTKIKLSFNGGFLMLKKIVVDHRQYSLMYKQFRKLIRRNGYEG